MHTQEIEGYIRLKKWAQTHNTTSDTVRRYYLFLLSKFPKPKNTPPLPHIMKFGMRWYVKADEVEMLQEFRLFLDNRAYGCMWLFNATNHMGKTGLQKLRDFGVTEQQIAEWREDYKHCCTEFISGNIKYHTTPEEETDDWKIWEKKEEEK